MMIYDFVGDTIFKFDKEGGIVGRLKLDKELLIGTKGALEQFKESYLKELLAAANNFDYRKGFYLKEVYKLFGESVDE